MAITTPSILAFLCIFNILTSLAVAASDVPTASSTNADVKHPDSFFTYDRSFLLPGFGRYMLPKDKKGFNPFTYNPVTGTNSGTGIGIGSAGGSGAGRSYVPGGDDTYVPNPGVEIPNPGAGGNVPVPSAAHP